MPHLKYDYVSMRFDLCFGKKLAFFFVYFAFDNCLSLIESLCKGSGASKRNALTLSSVSN